MVRAPCVPHDLPLTDLDWRRLLLLAGRANAVLARYDGMLQTLLDPAVLLSPITVSEAILSSRIEGTVEQSKGCSEVQRDRNSIIPH